MRVVLITQNDVFYLPDALAYLLDNFPEHSQIVGAVVLPVSPFGKREGFLGKMHRTLRIFGIAFFLRYGLKYLRRKLSGRDAVSVLESRNVPLLPIVGSINSKDSLDRISQLRPDLLVSIAGNQIFKKRLIELPPLRTLNLHTALLPKYRGLMPTFWVLKNDERYTGVSVFFVDEGIDSGPILVQRRVEIGDKTQEELIVETKKMGMDAIIEAVELIHRGEYDLIENPDSEKSYFSFPTRADIKDFYARGKRFY